MSWSPAWSACQPTRPSRRWSRLGGEEISNIKSVLAELGRRMGCDSRDWRSALVHGGSINCAYRIVAGDAQVFLKLNAADRIDMFVAEAEGLHELERACAIRVPRVVDVGCAGDAAFLALEWLELGHGGARAERRLGCQLAAQHRVTAADHGWGRNNAIGSTPQHNDRSDNWTEFFRERRLGFQLRLAQRNGLPTEAAAALRKVLTAIPTLLAGYDPEPSLLHGDLWGGNWGALSDATPAVFDPAVYFGDRETDLAMTRLFGGFGHEFYSAYTAELPLTPGWERRADLYNLYHQLNHFNLFGSAYLGAIRSTAARLE